MKLLLSYTPIFNLPSKNLGRNTVWYGYINHAQFMLLFMQHGLEGEPTNILILNEKGNLSWVSALIYDIVREW